MATPSSIYRGRFAPSPTGPLHFGSLVAALGSYLDARAHGGEWLVRMEDLDTPRVVPGAADDILRTLERFGLQWDGPVLYQSSRIEAYEAALENLRARGLVFPCICSRKDVGERYPGTCRKGAKPGRTSWRFQAGPATVAFVDRRLGTQSQNVEEYVGDFVLKRADGVFTYQMAVVVDDAFQGITHVVRGEDLLDSTPRQILLQRALGYPQPDYLHLPVVLNEAGQKLSKQTGAAVLDLNRVPELLEEARFLLASNGVGFAAKSAGEVESKIAAR
jgi:glutamyl-Q tRNA(Asp) synthetase